MKRSQSHTKRVQRQAKKHVRDALSSNQNVDLPLSASHDHFTVNIPVPTFAVVYPSDAYEVVEASLAATESDEECEDVISTENEASDEEINLQTKLHEWALKHDINASALSDLLNLLQHDHPYLPKDARTLLKTPKSIEIIPMDSGHYYYFGISKGLKGFLSNLVITSDMFSDGIIHLALNVDGIPLFNSSVAGIWAILARVCNFTSVVFTVGIYQGTGKPASVHAFLHDTIEEMKLLLENGFHENGVKYTIMLDMVCADTPARSFIKNIKGHSGYYGCDRCDIKGTYILNSVRFTDSNCERRTNETFRSKQQEEHHHGDSPFEQLNIDMIKQFPQDYMHSVCKGIVPKLVFIMRSGSFPYRCSNDMIIRVDQKLLFCRAYLPSDFNRLPRSIRHSSLWKATENRLFVI